MQFVQLVGAASILAAFALAQTGRMQPDRYVPICLNFVGALLLATSAYSAEQWGFLVLNTAWSFVAAWALFRRLLLSN